jgi:hypothetical protein
MVARGIESVNKVGENMLIVTIELWPGGDESRKSLSLARRKGRY